MYEATIIFKSILFLSEDFQVKTVITKYTFMNVVVLKAVPFEVS